MKTSAQASIGTIDRFIQEVGVAEKTAADKQAAAPLSEPGSIGGETKHPVKNVDDRLQAATEGARSKENEKDVKEDQGKPSVENAPEATAKSAAALDLSRFAMPMQKKAEGGAVMTPGSAADDHLQIGTKVAPTGDDPASETSSVKRTKDNPETTHPTGGEISQDGPQGGEGHKAGADYNTMSLEDMAKLAADLANSICADVTTEPQTQPRVKQAAAIDEAALASQAGWELAGMLSGNFDKQAADAMVQAELEAIIKTASDDADNVAHFLNNYYAAMQKQAAGEPPADPSADPAAMMAPPGGGVPMGGGEGGPMTGGAGGPMGAGPAGPMGGDPAAAGGGGGMEAALGGAGGAGGPEGGEGGGHEEELVKLLQLLEQLGVTPEELQQAMAEEAGGAGGPGGGGAGGPEMAGGGEEAGSDEGGGEPAGEPPIKAGGDRRATKTAAAVKKGGTKVGVREYIQEVISRSRR